jgi:tetratricopeptide (TPR) repeat protein
VLVVAIPSLLSLGRFRNGFVFDDVFVIQRGSFIHDPSNLKRVLFVRAMAASSLDASVGQPGMDTYRPLPIASFLLDAALSGRETWAYHLTNTLLHAAVCVLLFETARALLPTATPWFSAGLTLCFGLAPWLSEAHVWINGRSDLWAALFGLSALLWQRAYLERPQLRLAIGAGVSALLALLSKEMALVFLGFVALVPVARSVARRTRLLSTLPLALAAGVYLALRWSALHGLRSHEGSAQLWQALRNLPLLELDGALHSLIPSFYALRSLEEDYAGVAPVWRWLSLLLLLAALVLWALSLRRHPLLAWCLAVAASTLAPAALITTVLWPGFGRYLYTPCLGFVLALGYGLTLLARRHSAQTRVVALLPWLLAAANAPFLVDATAVFHDEDALYTRALERAPEQAWTYGFLGLARKRDGDCDGAIPLLNRAATQQPSEPRYALQLGHCLLSKGARAEVQALAARGIQRFAGTRAEAGFLALSFASLPTRDPARAAPLLRRCLQLDPRRAECAEALREVEAELSAPPSP